MATHGLNEQDKWVLTMIQRGYTYMFELVDLSGWGGEKVNRSIEVLDEQRYIAREGLAGVTFWGFYITQKGMDVLPPLSVEESKLFKVGLNSMDVRVLKMFQEQGGENIPGLLINAKMPDATEHRTAVASVLKLLRLGHLDQMGFLKRRVKISERGMELLARIA
jgi:hypothetical protein